MKFDTRRWDIVHKFETEYNRKVFKNLSPRDSFKVFLNLYEFAHKVRSREDIRRIDADKIKNLSKIHSIFNKIKI